MKDPLHIPRSERETVRVFALDLPPTEAESLADAPRSNGAASRLAEMAGVAHLDRDHVEIFPASDLKGLGLSGYLSEGLGIDDAELAADSPALDAETGYIVVLHSPAFGGVEVTLSPKPPLRHLGTYRLVQPETPGPMPTAESGAPVGTPETAAAPIPVARLPRVVALLVLLGAAALVLLLAYLVGGRG